MSVLQARGIRKSYGGVVALKSCELAIDAGTVHALLGENGAGKSTLVKILTGGVRPDEGAVLLDGARVQFHDADDAARHGIAVVSQELNLFPDLTVLANLFLGREPTRFGAVDQRAMLARAEGVLGDLGLHIAPNDLLGELSLAEQQLVEIARALLTNPRVLILDEPTSALDDNTSSRLLDVIRVLRTRSVGVVFVSHILEEVMALSDVVTILRDGVVVVPARPRGELTIPLIVQAMVGDQRTIASIENAEKLQPTAPHDQQFALDVEGVASTGRLHGVSLTAYRGEIVGLAGVVGAGHRSLLSVIAGGEHSDSGTIRLPGDELPRRPPRSRRDSVLLGIATVSGDRKRGLLFDRPIWVNMAQVNAVALGRDGHVIHKKRLLDRARQRIAELNIRTSGPEQTMSMLSGGNQQKVVLAKWVDARPSVILLDDPTRGVAVASKADIHRLLRQVSEEAATLLCSTDLDELVTLCARVVVFRQGRIVAELSGELLNRAELLTQMNISDSEVEVSTPS